MPLSSSATYPQISLKTLVILSVFSFMVCATSASKAEAKQNGLLAFFLPFESEAKDKKLASKTISLEKRHANEWISKVFKDNILLTIAYMAEKPKTSNPDWDEIRKPFSHAFTLKPGEAFAFHDAALLPEYAPLIVKTTNAHYSEAEGFRSSGRLMGDGVCHFASLLYWVAKEAGLESVAPVNHDFAAIAEIDKKYGVAIYTDFANPTNSMNQNLYIKNNQSVDITLKLVYNGKDLTIDVLKKS